MRDLIIIGFDSEWVYQPDTNTNHILSYQYFGKTSTGTWSGIIYTNGSDRRKHRLKFGDVIGKAIEAGRTEGVLGRQWPKKVFAAAHFTRADLAGFKDYSTFKCEFDAVRGTYTTIIDPYVYKFRDKHKHKRDLKIILRDTAVLSPNNSSLESLGELHGVEKITLPEGAIERMDKLLTEDAALFEGYAIRDAEIAAIHAWKMAEFSRDNGLKSEPPVTIGGLATKLLLNLWDVNQISLNDVLGKEYIKKKLWNRSTRKYRTSKQMTDIAVVHNHSTLATEAYHGGRNEAYMFGFTKLDNWIDLDLGGAYSTALSAIKTPDYRTTTVSTQVADYKKDCFGFAHLKFTFPDNTQYPCLPVRTDNGLIYPLTGETHVCSPEIELAVNLGAEIEIIHGIIIPWANNVRPFEIFSRTVREKRGELPKKSVFEQTWKEIGNSVYGKLAQGLREKRAYDSRTEGSKSLPPSKITQPYLAAYTTSIIRAVLGELLARLPDSKTIVSATTDGFLSNANLDEVDTSGPLAQFFADLTELMTSHRNILEVKHQNIPQVLCLKTRGQTTVGIIGSETKTLVAKAGNKAPVDVLQMAEQSIKNDLAYTKPDDFKDIVENYWLLNTFIKRTAETSTDISSFIPMREMAKYDADLIRKTITRKLSMEYDWKRQLVEPEMVLVGQVIDDSSPHHITLQSKPWRTIEDFKDARSAFDRWRSDKEGVLKTLTDWATWTDYQRLTSLRSDGQYGGRGTPLQQFKRWFLKAYTCRAYNLPGTDYKRLAEWLTKNGYITTVTDIKNAKRSVIAITPTPSTGFTEVQKFCDLLLSRYPQLGFTASVFSSSKSNRS